MEPFARTILHVDLDAFYTSVEQRDDPSLVGKPVVVGGDSKRGVVAAASYEARKFGIHSAMPMVQALSRCAHLVVAVGRMSHYADVSHEFFAILDRYSPLVEGLSLDEAFLDVTGEERLFGSGVDIARRIKSDVDRELKLVASVGVAPSKFLAKIGSDLQKPDGLVEVRPDAILPFLHPLPVSRLWGVGKVTQKELAGMALRTIGDIARFPRDVLARRIGARTAQHLWALANGLDDREVVPHREPVSVGHEDTFAKDCHDRASLAPHLLAQADRVCARVRKLACEARVITVKVKYADHKLITRRVTISAATADGRVVGKEAVRLLQRVPDIESRGVRLTGVSLSQLVPQDGARQLSFDERERVRGKALSSAVDQIAARFGGAIVRRAVNLPDMDSDE